MMVPVVLSKVTSVLVQIEQKQTGDMKMMNPADLT